MAFKSFDIGSLLNFTPPEYLCENCRAILADLPGWRRGRPRHSMYCPVCEVEYYREDGNHYRHMRAYMREAGNHITFDNLIEHSCALAEIAQKARRHVPSEGRNIWDDYPPMRCLLLALLNAKQFVHFVSYGINDMLIGALKVVAQRVWVCGIVSNATPRQIEELDDHREEAPQLFVRTFPRIDALEGLDQSPHQKLIVIDGLIAFKGSANLTLNGWRKAASGRDTVEVETNVREVAKLNNRLFSPVWGSFSDKQRWSWVMSPGVCKSVRR